MSMLLTFIMLRKYTILTLLKNLSRKTIDLFCKNGKADLKIHMELQRAPNSQNNIEKEKQCSVALT